MNKKIIGAFVVLTFLVGCGCQQNEEENASDAIQPSEGAVTYDCEGESVKADFNNDAEPSTVTIYVANKDMTLPNVETGSGARYSDGDVTFWTHQSEATLSMEDTGASLNCVEVDSATNSDVIVDENGNTITQGCENWFDGCNNCQVSPDGMLACTRMFCDPATMQLAKCLDEESLDNDKQVCAEAGGVWSEEHDSCFEDPATMAGEGEK